ncbi:Na+/H+ antiporter NhaA [Phyllobacterium salinisoli]|nr:Na+/H+ antiporter NhaA [Phyllobacterium salinisoli]
MNQVSSLLRPKSVMRRFLDSEASGGIVLMFAAALALIVANSPLAETYFHTLHVEIGGLSVLHWINDALMVVFFLLVGLEIKREFLDGQLASWSNRILPGIAAAGGVAVPALIFAYLNASNPETIRGWAIPSATDIAFALGVISLLGSRVPTSLKVFLATLAILDDLAAVAIIAVFYTSDLALPYLGGAVAATLVLITLNRMGVMKLLPYLVVGVVLWYLVLRSGVHATVAGVVLAMTIPLRPAPGRPDDMTSPLHKLEHALSNWVSFLVVPVFGFANAGISFSGLDASVLTDTLTLGIALGLFLGKQIGVFGTAWLAIKLRLSAKPMGASWTQLYGVSLLCGIGFTMSLFIGLLSFTSDHLHDETKIGVLLGSFLSAVCGWLVLRFSGKPKLEEKVVLAK